MRCGRDRGAPPSFGGATCASLGFPAGGSLTCAPNCSAVTGRDRLSLRAEFAIPSAFGTLHPATAGMSLLVGDDAGGNKLALTIPPGAHWSERRGRWLYRDRAGSVGGIRKLVITDDSRGGVPGVDVSVTGRNGSYPLAFADLPLAVTILLGDATAGQAGSCGRRSFDAGSCANMRGGARLVCH